MTDSEIATPKMTNQNSRRLWDLAVTFLVFAGIVVAVSRTVVDPDLWGHLQYGLDMIKNGAVLKVDPYSYLTAGQPWINHEWLAEVMLALAWTAAGGAGLVLVKTAAWTLAYALPFVHLRRTGLPPLRAGILVLLSLPLIAPVYATVRPHIFTALLFALILWMMLEAEAGRYRWLWAAPIIFILWPNLHGAFPAGLGVLGLWGLIHLLQHRSRAVWLHVIPPLLLSVLAILANPWGLRLPMFILEHLGDRRLEITEWLPIEIASLHGSIYLAWIGLIVLGLIYTRRTRHLSLILPLVVTAYMPLLGVRYILFFGLAAIMLAGEHIGDAWSRLMPLRSSARISRWAVLLALVAGVFVLGWKITNFGGIPGPTATDHPINTVALLQESQVAGNLAVHFNWSDYAIWHLTPEIKVSMDTRREMAYSGATYRMNVRFMTGMGRWDELLTEHPTTMALVPRYTPTDNLLQAHPDWVRIFQDQASSLYALRTSTQAQLLQAAVRNFQPVEAPVWFPNSAP